ncbi:MAG TPA: sulfate transporter CysZ [Sedimenticola sp.]|nr:sulfate transporter CysZ [Sedimenticola sp.]
MKDNPITGTRYLIKGFRLLFRPGLRRYLLVPLVINILVFSLIGWLGYINIEGVLERLLPEQSWLHYFRWLLWPLFAIAFLMLVFYTFTVVANLLAAPFNGLLAEKVELMLTGKPPTDAHTSIAAAILPSLLSEIRKLFYFLLRAIPLLLLFLIPVINVAAPFLWFAFSAWFLTMEYIDYPMGNHGLGFRQQLGLLKQRRLISYGFGGGVTLLMLIPIVNFAAMPAAVAGATALWCDLGPVLAREGRDKG